MEFQVEHVVHAAPAEVAKIMFDPSREPEWSGTATKVEVLTPGPFGVGSRVRREGGFLGAKFTIVTEVTAFEPDRILEMDIVEGPTHGTVVYEVSPTAGGSIAMIHTRNKPNRPAFISGLILKHDAGEDLGRLARLVMAEHNGG